MASSSAAVLALAVALGLLCLGGASPQRLLQDGSVRTGDQPADYQRAMSKRAALLLDRLLVALQQAVENKELQGSKQYVRSLPNFSGIPDTQGMLTDEKTMDLQRRGQAKGRVYWRCYFNAVTCFKRK